MTLTERIKKKQQDIQKRKNLIIKQEKKIELITSESDLRWAKDDLRTSQSKLKDLEIQLENLFKQQEKEQKKNEVERIPVIEEFLEQWKIKALEWFKNDYQKLNEYFQEVSEKRNQFKQWQDENKIYHYGKEYKEKEKELGLDRETYLNKLKYSFHSLTQKLYQLYRKDWEKELEREIERDKNNKRQFLVSRVKEITGQITDAKGLRIGDNGEINGIIIGIKGTAKVETISAGGYNIQCWHFRVLVKEIK